MVCVPSGVTEVEKRAVRNHTGRRQDSISDGRAGCFATIGAGIDISKPDGTMVIDIERRYYRY